MAFLKLYVHLPCGFGGIKEVVVDKSSTIKDVLDTVDGSRSFSSSDVRLWLNGSELKSYDRTLSDYNIQNGQHLNCYLPDAMPCPGGPLPRGSAGRLPSTKNDEEIMAALETMGDDDEKMDTDTDDDDSHGR